VTPVWCPSTFQIREGDGDEICRADDGNGDGEGDGEMYMKMVEKEIAEGRWSYRLVIPTRKADED
jgi:hypothetical protein